MKTENISTDQNQIRFSANLGFLWRELPFLERIKKASQFGFDAVEFHDDAQDADQSVLIGLLEETELPVVCLNTKMGETIGRAAIAGMESQAREDIDQASEIAELLSCRAVHVLAGKTSGPKARETFLKNLEYALSKGNLDVLIEPISKKGIDGYFLNSLAKAAEIIDEIAHPRLKILFDCYHIRWEYADVFDAFERYFQKIGHIQIASFPDRAEPSSEGIDYTNLLKKMTKFGYSGAFGCEYLSRSNVEEQLNWRETIS